MKQYKIIATLYYTSAILLYLAAFFNFISGSHNSPGVACLGLGSAFLCLGFVYVKKIKKSEDKKSEDKKEQR